VVNPNPKEKIYVLAYIYYVRWVSMLAFKKYISIIGLILLINTAYGLPEIGQSFDSKYNTQNTRLDKCILCHNIEKPKSCEYCHAFKNQGQDDRDDRDLLGLNLYGKALKEQIKMKKDMNRAFTATENLDSDNDGISNKNEILNKSFPGNRTDKTKNGD
jgi:hypothetical protein